MSIRGVHTWEGTCSAKWPRVGFWIIAAMTIGFVILAIAVEPWFLMSAAATSISAIAILPFTQIKVTTGPNGLTINYGRFGWPQQNIPLDQIEHASVMDDLNPWKWGGWGYRGMLWLFRRAAVNLRRGPAIRLQLTRRRVFVVTVDQPALGVNVLNQAIELRPPNPVDD